MTEAKVILLASRPHLAGLGLDPEDMGRELGNLVNPGQIRMVDDWTSLDAGAFSPEDRLVLVGRSDPWPGGPPGQWPLNLNVEAPWLAGPLNERVSALVRAAVAEAARLETPPARLVEPDRTVLVWGDGLEAGRVVERIAKAGFPVLWAGRRPGNQVPGVTALPCSGLRAVEGFPGRFTVWLDDNGHWTDKAAGAVVLCGRLTRRAGLEFETGPGLISLSTLEDGWEREQKPDWAEEPGFRLVFLAGAGRPPTPHGLGRILSLALRARRETKAVVYVLAPQIQVAGPGLERLSGRARQAGLVFLRTPLQGPDLTVMENGRLRITMPDLVARADLSLTPDLLVLEDEVIPDPELTDLAAALGLTVGNDGFPSPDNVLFPAGTTNRAGILAIGPARGTDAPEILDREILAGLDVLQELLTDRTVEDRLIVDRGRCTLCLTCVRICPHQALSFTNRPWADPLACSACGLCVAECPMDALQLPDHTDGRVKARLAALLARPRTEAPRLVMYGCRRSAARAMRIAPRPDEPVDLAFIPLPCAGRIEADLVLTAFLGGADGVLIAACHDHNCRTQQGGPEARRRMGYHQDLLAESGFRPERLGYITLAPNMGREFTELVTQFHRAVRDLNQPPASGDPT